MLREQDKVLRGENQNLKATNLYKKEFGTKTTDNALLSYDNRREVREIINSSINKMISFYSRNLKDDINSNETNESIHVSITRMIFQKKKNS